MSESFQAIQRELQALSDPQKAKSLQRYFKTGPGEYGENDVFIGLTVPQIRSFAKRHCHLPRSTTLKLLKSRIHEERLLALMILVGQFQKGDDSIRKNIYQLYWDNRRFINNWDLVDGSAPIIVGGWLFARSRRRLYQLAKSKNIWDRRIAILSTLYFIRKSELNETYALAERLLKDKEDLIHKAVGWMLREAGKRDRQGLRSFLEKNAPRMPRTMLRYAIEKLEPKERQRIMKLSMAP